MMDILLRYPTMKLFNILLDINIVFIEGIIIYVRHTVEERILQTDD